MNINFDKISIIDDSFSKEKLMKLKEIACKEKMIIADSKCLYKTNLDSKLNVFKAFPLTTKAAERIYLSRDYSDYSMQDKNIILSNITFSRDESFANIIAISGLTVEQLDKYLQIVSFFDKNRNLINSKIPKVAKLAEYGDKISLVLKKYIYRHYPKVTEEMIINKLSELLCFNRELVLEKYDEYAGKREKNEIDKKNKELKKKTANIKYGNVSKDNVILIDSFVKTLSNIESLELIYYTCFNKRDDKCHVDFSCVIEDDINLNDIEMITAKLDSFAKMMKEENVIINYDIITNTELCLNIKKQDAKTIKRLSGANLIYQKKLGITKAKSLKHK